MLIRAIHSCYSTNSCCSNASLTFKFDDKKLAGRYSWSHAVATRSRWRRGNGFNGKGRVGGARKYDEQLLTALCGGSWKSGSRCWDVELSTLKLGKSFMLYIHVNKCISCMIHRCFDLVGTMCDLLTARPNRYNNHAPTEPLATS